MNEETLKLRFSTEHRGISYEIRLGTVGRENIAISIEVDGSELRSN
jgi:hypothetical protein